MHWRIQSIILLVFILLNLLSIPSYSFTLYYQTQADNNDNYSERIGWIVGVFRSKGTIRLVANTSTWVFSKLTGSIVGIYSKPIYLDHLNYTGCNAPGISCIIDQAVRYRMFSNGGLSYTLLSKSKSLNVFQQLGMVWLGNLSVPVDMLVDNYYRIHRNNGYAQIDFYQIWRTTYVRGLQKEKYLGITISWRLYFNNIMLYRIKLSDSFKIRPLTIVSTPYDYWNPTEIVEGNINDTKWYLIKDPEKDIGLLVVILSPNNVYRVLLDPSESGFLFGPSIALRIEYNGIEIPVREVKIAFSILRLRGNVSKEVGKHVKKIIEFYNEGNWPNSPPNTPRWLINNSIGSLLSDHTENAPASPLILKQDGFYATNGSKVGILGLNAGNPIDRVYARDFSEINETLLKYYAMFLKKYGYNAVKLIIPLHTIYNFNNNRPYINKIENIVKTIEILGNHGIYVVLVGGRGDLLRDNRSFKEYKQAIIDVFKEIIERLHSSESLHYVLYIDVVSEKEGIRNWTEFSDLLASFKDMIESLNIHVPFTISVCSVHDVLDTNYADLVDIIDVHLYTDKVVSNALLISEKARNENKPWIVGETGVWNTGYPVKEYRLEMLPNGSLTEHKLPVYLWYPPWRLAEITFKRLIAPIAMNASGVFWYSDITLYYSSLKPTPLLFYVGDIYKFVRKYIVRNNFRVSKLGDQIFMIKSKNITILMDDFTSGARLYDDFNRKYIVSLQDGLFRYYTPRFDYKLEKYFIDSGIISGGKTIVYSRNPLILVNIGDVESPAYYGQPTVLVLSAMAHNYFLYDYHALLNAMGVTAYVADIDIGLSLLKQYLDLVDTIIIPGENNVSWRIESGMEEWRPRLSHEGWREILDRVRQGYMLILLDNIYRHMPSDIYNEIFRYIEVDQVEEPRNVVTIYGLGTLRLAQGSNISIRIINNSIEILGIFEDGSPAIVKYGFGNGTIIYIAFDWYNIKPALYSNYSHNVYVKITPIKEEDGWTVLRDNIIVSNESKPWFYDNSSIYVRKDLVEALETYLKSKTSSREFGRVLVYLITNGLNEGILPPYTINGRVYEAACTFRIADWPGPYFRTMVDKYNLSNLRIDIAVTDEISMTPEDLKKMTGSVKVEWHSHPHGLLVLDNKTIKIPWGKGEIWQALYEIDYINKTMLPYPSRVATGIHTVNEDGMLITQLIINQSWTDVPWIGERGFPTVTNNKFSENWANKLQPLVTWYSTTMAVLEEEARSKNPVVAALFSLLPTDIPKNVWIDYGSLSENEVKRIIESFNEVLPSLIDNGYVIGGVIPGIADNNSAEIFGTVLKRLLEDDRVLVTNITYLMKIVRDRFNVRNIKLVKLYNRTYIVSVLLSNNVSRLPIRLPINNSTLIPVVIDKDNYSKTIINSNIIYLKANRGYHYLKIALIYNITSILELVNMYHTYVEPLMSSTAMILLYLYQK